VGKPGDRVERNPSSRTYSYTLCALHWGALSSVLGSTRPARAEFTQNPPRSFILHAKSVTGTRVVAATGNRWARAKAELRGNKPDFVLDDYVFGRNSS